MAGCGDRVSWRLELPGAWGGRLDPAWLPTGGQEGWRRIFEVEDLAARVFAAGGARLRWAQLAEAAATLAGTLAEYRMQWRVAEQVAARCPTSADGHLAALAVDPALRPPRRSHPGGRWRLCGLVDGSPVTLDEFGSSDLAEGCAVAHRTGATAQAYWAQPAAAGPAAPPGARDQGWTPVVDTALRLAAFAAEESVATLCAAAATGHTGPDVLSRRLLCQLGLVTHRMILEYRTLFRAAWTDMDACGLSAAHDADAEARLTRRAETHGRRAGRTVAARVAGRRMRGGGGPPRILVVMGLPGQAARAVQQCAEELEDAAWLGCAAFVWGAATGELDRAAQYRRSVTAAETLTSKLGSSDAVQACGMLHLMAATAAGARGDHDTSATHLDEAAVLADRMDTEVGTWANLWFGPTSVDFYRTSLALTFGEPGQALEAAKAVHSKLLPNRRQAEVCSAVGRALCTGKKTRHKGVHVLLHAEHLAPQRIHTDVLVRETVADLLRQARRDAGGRELRGLAWRMGIAPLK